MTLTPSQAHRYDGVRYRAGNTAHVESYFLKINDPNARRALWVKATILANAREAVAESWAIAFDGARHVAVKSTFPIADASFAKDDLDVQLPNLRMSRDVLHAHMKQIDVDLVLHDPNTPLVHFPTARMYEGRFPSGKLISPLPDLRAEGVVTVDGERWDVSGWHGLLGHNWGRSHAFAYAWGHCNVWDGDEDVVFEGTSGRVRVGPVTTPTTTILLVRHHGVHYELNRVRDLLRNRGSMTTRRWQFSGASPTVSIRGEMWSNDEDMVGLHYLNPDGAMTYCLNSKLASARVEIAVRGRAPLVLRSQSAALEIGTRDPNHGIEMVL